MQKVMADMHVIVPRGVEQEAHGFDECFKVSA